MTKESVNNSFKVKLSLISANDSVYDLGIKLAFLFTNFEFLIFIILLNSKSFLRCLKFILIFRKVLEYTGLVLFDLRSNVFDYLQFNNILFPLHSPRVIFLASMICSCYISSLSGFNMILDSGLRLLMSD